MIFIFFKSNEHLITNYHHRLNHLDVYLKNIFFNSN